MIHNNIVSSGPLGFLCAAEAVECLQGLSALIVCCDLARGLGGDCGALRFIAEMNPIGTTTRQQALRAEYPLPFFMQFYLATFE